MTRIYIYYISEFCPSGDIWQCLETFLVNAVEEGMILALIGRAQEGYPYSTMHRQPLTTKNYPVQNVNS